MPIEITDRYRIKCDSCSYVWDTKYAQVPAKCPSCGIKIYGTENYSILTRYIHNEQTDEEKRQAKKIAGMIILGFFVLISLILRWWIAFVILSVVMVVWYSLREDSNQSKNETTGHAEINKTINVPSGKKEIRINLNCPKCGGSIDYNHTLGNEGNIEMKCKHCKSNVVLKLTRFRSWKCDFCGKKFEDKTEGEAHEETCSRKK